VYSKNSSGTAGSDRGWVDQVSYSSAAYANWAATFGLTGNAALPETDVEGDGLGNLQEFAFNLNPNQPGVPVLTPGTGTAGLPLIRLVGSGSARHLAIEFIRRKNGGVLYTPQFADSPGTGNWQPALVPAVVTSIDANWERVVVEDNAEIGTRTRRFGRVLIANP
jgi:hypothetical protein